MEQLTLEQAATNHSNKFMSGTTAENSFKAGAEWQKEQYKKILQLAFEAANVCDRSNASDLANEIKNNLELIHYDTY